LPKNNSKTALWSVTLDANDDISVPYVCVMSAFIVYSLAAKILQHYLDTKHVLTDTPVHALDWNAIRNQYSNNIHKNIFSLKSAAEKYEFSA